MNKHLFISVTIITAAVALTACTPKRQSATNIVSPYSDEVLADEVEIPFTEQHGVKLVSVTIGDDHRITLPKVIFDTGAAYTHITAAEADYLYEQNELTSDEIKDFVPSFDANNNVTYDREVVLRKLVIGQGIEVDNVHAVVKNDIEAPLLLGQSVLERFPNYTIDNEKGVIRFHL